jgi:hypothetical protein
MSIGVAYYRASQIRAYLCTYLPIPNSCNMCVKQASVKLCFSDDSVTYISIVRFILVFSVSIVYLYYIWLYVFILCVAVFYHVYVRK